MRTNILMPLALLAICFCECQGSKQGETVPSATRQAPSAAQTQPGYTIADGRIGASLIRIAAPTRWNKNVLILVHGLRTADAPLTAEFSTKSAMFNALIGEGWMIASTSFRRNGYIIKEAIEDYQIW